MNYIYEEMIKLGADGVIFHSICSHKRDIFMKSFGEYTIDTIKTLTAIPRSSRTYYKLVSGEKKFYDWEQEKYIDIDFVE